MDHLEAKRLHAAEKYVLGELSMDQRDAYEELVVGVSHRLGLPSHHDA